MPTTGHGLVYPDSTGNVNLWEHLQALADSTETALDAIDVTGTVDTAAFTAATNWTLGTQTLRQIGRAIYFDVLAVRATSVLTNPGDGNLANTLVATWNTTTYPILFDAHTLNNGSGYGAIGLAQSGNLYICAVTKTTDVAVGNQLQFSGHWISA